MKLYALRHAQKQGGDYYSASLRHQDCPLTPAGEEAALRLADWFAPIHIDRILASGYLRAERTARHIAASKGLPLERDPRLNEIDDGTIEGLSHAEIQAKYPEFWADFSSRSKDVRFPGGETGEEVMERQQSLLSELIAADQDVLLVAHEVYIRLLVCNLTGLPPYKRHLFRVDFCGLTEAEYSRDTGLWRIIRVNQTTV